MVAGPAGALGAELAAFAESRLRRRRGSSLAGISREVAAPPLNCGRMLSVARSVSRLITRCASARMASASTTTKPTRNSRWTGAARKVLVSSAARPLCVRFQTRRQAMPGAAPQLPISVVGA
jgi:hypothetical protein